MSIAFTDTFIRNLKTVGRYTDSATQGLNLQIKKAGGKYWTFRYQYQGKRHDLGLGTTPPSALKRPEQGPYMPEMTSIRAADQRLLGNRNLALKLITKVKRLQTSAILPKDVLTAKRQNGEMKNMALSGMPLSSSMLTL